MESIVLLPLGFLGGIFYSVRQLPHTWDVVSQINPVFWLVQVERIGLVGSGDVSAVSALVVVWGQEVALCVWSAGSSSARADSRPRARRPGRGSSGPGLIIEQLNVGRVQPNCFRVHVLDAGRRVKKNPPSQPKWLSASSGATLAGLSGIARVFTDGAPPTPRVATPSSSTSCSNAPAGASCGAGQNTFAASIRCTAGQPVGPVAGGAEAPFSGAMSARRGTKP